mgnify:CR=1 FL=1
MHVTSFLPNDPLDSLHLPPSEGGLAYLGRVNVTLDDGTRRVAVADHYLKWAFHFLVDADPLSPSHGMPLRLYGPLGVRQVFHDWVLGDPARHLPEVWSIPGDCKIKSDACKEFM